MTNQKKIFSLRNILLILFVIVILPFSPLLLTQRWNWWEAWLYGILCVLGFVISRGLAARAHPDLVRERAQFTDNKDTQPWDKILAPIAGIGGGFLPVAAGVETLLGRTYSFSLVVKIIALAIFIAGYVFATYALVENTFFSGTVRLQSERGQHVITSGPYRWVRHPGYAGGLISFLVSPFILDSWWALVPGILITVVLFLRTKLEDDFLQKELPGYQDYAKKVQSRLIPGVW